MNWITLYRNDMKCSACLMCPGTASFITLSGRTGLSAVHSPDERSDERP